MFVSGMWEGDDVVLIFQVWVDLKGLGFLGSTFFFGAWTIFGPWKSL